MKKSAILIAHNHEVYMSGLVNEIKQDDRVIEVKKDGDRALQWLLKKKPSIAILDSELSKISVFDVIKTTREKGIDTRFILIFPQAKEQYVTTVRAYGVEGALVVRDSVRRIKECVIKVLDNKNYISPFFPKIKNRDINQLLGNLNRLSKTELRLLAMVDKHNTSRAIAEALDLSTRTVEKHRSNIIKKLKLERKTNSLSRWVIENNVLVQELTSKL